MSKSRLYYFNFLNFLLSWVGWLVGWWVGGWLKFLLILRLTQPILAGVGAGPELGNTSEMFYIKGTRNFISLYIISMSNLFVNI